MNEEGNPFSEEDRAHFETWRRQADLADPIIERSYAELAGEEGAWVAFRDGELIAKGPDLDEVMRSVEARGWSHADVYTRFLLGKDVIFIPTNFPPGTEDQVRFHAQKRD